MQEFSSDSFVCDSSALISLTDSCLLDTLYMLKRRFKGSFLIPPSVEYECIEHPLQMKSHAIHALRLKRALKNNIITAVRMDLRRETEEILALANNIFFIGGKPLKLLHEGEADMLALANAIDVRNILIDERTTRTLIEAPESLKKHLEQEFKKTVAVNEEYLKKFRRLARGMQFFRSSEILILAYERGYFRDYEEMEKQTLEAALYALKFNGCSISFEEVEEFMGTLR